MANHTIGNLPNKSVRDFHDDDAPGRLRIVLLRAVLFLNRSLFRLLHAALAGELLTGAIAAGYICTSTRQLVPRSAVIVMALAGGALILGSLLLM